MIGADLVGTLLVAGLTLAVLALGASVLVPARHRNAAAGALIALLGLDGVAVGVAAQARTGQALAWPIALPTLPPLEAPILLVTPLGGVFCALAGGVIAVAALFGIGYASGPAASRTGWASFTVFALGLLGVPGAGDVVTFLLAWELMALGSTVLLLADHAARASVRTAAAWYAVMTHLSFLSILAGFGVLAAAAGGTTWATIAGAHIEGPTATLAFALLIAGFGTKAGLVPVHVWLPRAHPEAPSHASAVMSAAMVKMGVYGILLVVADLLPVRSTVWGIALVAVGAVSAVYGILQASVQTDLKRVLAYSTTENVGLIVTAIGAGVLLRAVGQDSVSSVAWVAALLLAGSHAAFKTVLFLGAGSVLHATGQRDLDALGGLARRMPWTSTTFAIGALGAAGLPVTAGFVAEWTLLQALVHAEAASDRLVGIAIPVTMGVVALTIGLGLLTFTKAYGIAFLARPRTAAAADAHEGTATMRAALVVGAVGVVALGLIPGPVGAAFARSLGDGSVAAGEGAAWSSLVLPRIGQVLDPAALTILAVALSVPLALAHWWLARRAPRRDVALTWGCGGDASSPRMEYNAISYSEPLVRVFRGSLAAERRVDVQAAPGSSVLASDMVVVHETHDVIEDRLYLPGVRLATRLADAARRVQNGSIRRYLTFSFVALLAVLVVISL